MNMRNCSVCKKLEIVPGKADDYKALAHYHYRDSRLGPFKAIFALKPRRGKETIGVIVYTMPSPRLELRNVATSNLFTGFDRSTQLALINKNICCIGRVIIEPRFRSLGLASRLVRETMPQLKVPIIEAMAVMGMVNPFFEKAGMKAHTAKISARCAQLIEAFSVVGIEKKELIDAKEVQRKLQRLAVVVPTTVNPSPCRRRINRQADFIERQIQLFLQGYGRRRTMPAGLQRTRYILSRLTERPVYYIWFNPHWGVQRK